MSMRTCTHASVHIHMCAHRDQRMAGLSLSPSTLSPQDSLLLDLALAIFQLDRMKSLLVNPQTAPSEQVCYSWKDSSKNSQPCFSVHRHLACTIRIYIILCRRGVKRRQETCKIIPSPTLSSNFPTFTHSRAVTPE